jgi:outer membrane protease
MKRSALCALPLFFCGLSATPALSAGMITQSLDGKIRLSGSVGLMNIEANEIVYTRNRELSHLIWESKGVTVFNSRLDMDATKDWTLSVSGNFGIGGDGHMVDYDWISPYYTSTDTNGWSDRSIHPDTRLDHYFKADVQARRAMWSDDANDIGMSGGVQYTQVQWTAWGGSYLYSVGGARNSPGTISDSSKAITFKQMTPVVYVGFDAKHISGAWTFSGNLQGGLTIGASAVDNHWLRNLEFTDNYQIAPIISATIGAEYQWSAQTSLYASARFDRVMTAHGNTVQTNTSTGVSSWFADSAGGDLVSANLSLGLKARF